VIIMRTVTVAALQQLFTDDMTANIAAVSARVEEAASKGAQIILPSELFQGHYFCKTQREEEFSRAWPIATHPAVIAMQKLARQLKVYLPTSVYEKDGHHYYNTLAMIDDAGDIMGTYRKSHIPDGPGYQEKFYFRPGNTGFKVWETKYARIGVGICWDQWYPECARAMMLMGAELLFYPTAIGAEPHDPGLDTRRLWRRAMVGHAVSNVVPVIAANRVGVEGDQSFYGTSFIVDHRGDIVSDADDAHENVLIAKFDLDAIQQNRFAFGFFRDRRPELYARLTQDI
jgi:N-carbamoylputrescine amidase